MLQNFNAPIVAPFTHHDTKSSLEDNPPVNAESNEQKHSTSCGDDEEAHVCFEPHYLARNLSFLALSRNNIQSTIFSTFSNSSTDLIEQLDLSQEFESLINENTGLLTKDQTEKVADVRKQLQLQSFEILFAAHR